MSTAIDVSGDSGILKTILTASTSDSNETPPNGANVSVHYVGKLLDGTVFDSSRERDQVFQFKIGKGSVIKGWDLGVATMKKGEVALLRCRSDYAYGDRGSPPKIPGGATLEFEVELLDWDEYQKVTTGLKKKVLIKGEGWDGAADGELIRVRYTSYSSSGSVVEDVRDVREMRVGTDPLVPEMLETMLKDVKKGETSEYVLESATSGAVKYVIECVDLEKGAKSWEMSHAQKLERMGELKEFGNAFFKAGDFTRAEQRYKAAIECMQYEKDVEAKILVQLNALRVSVYGNLAAIALKTKAYEKVISNCGKALEIDASNVKALYRRAFAYLSTGDASSALADSRKGLETDPENKGLKGVKARAVAAIKAARAKEMKTFGGMFDKVTLVEESLPRNNEGNSSEAQ